MRAAFLAAAAAAASAVLAASVLSLQRSRAGARARPSPRGVIVSGADQRYSVWAAGRMRTMTPSVASESGTGVGCSAGSVMTTW